MEELEKEGYVVTQPGRWVLKPPLGFSSTR
jgi:hypothetical protein